MNTDITILKKQLEYLKQKGYRVPEIARITTLGDMIEEFEGLCIKAQDIISKYKK